MTLRELFQQIVELLKLFLWLIEAILVGVWETIKFLWNLLLDTPLEFLLIPLGVWWAIWFISDLLDIKSGKKKPE